MPSLKDWLFSAASFTAAALALFIAFSLDLDRPYWALTTVYITAQPFAGATRAKATWRLVGTLAGGVFTVAALPNLVDAPELLSLAFAGWIALCLACSLLDPTPRSYAFILAGYTAALIGFPSVDNPGAIFQTALSRCEEISLGIVCAWFVHGVLFPRQGVPILRQRLTAWMSDIARFGANSLQQRFDGDDFAAERRRVARDGAALNALYQQARYELIGPSALLWLPRLHERARLVPGLITFIGDRAAALRKEDAEAHAAMRPLLDDVAGWLAETARMSHPETADATAVGLLERIRLAGAGARRHKSWSSVLAEGIAARLTELVESWRECVSLGHRMLSAEPAGAPPPAEVVRTPGHTDPLLLALSCLAAALGIVVGCAFWIATGWKYGASVPTMAAVITCVLAQLDDPASLATKFIAGALLSTLAVGVLLFAVFPAIDGFPLLLVALGVLFLPVGAFQAVPAYGRTALAMAFFSPSLLSLQETYHADFAIFADSGAAVVLGAVLCVVVNRLVRSVGVEWRLQRFAAADRRDLLRLVEGQPGELRRIVNVMLDRFEALAARLTTGDARTFGVAELADVRASVNVLRLRELADRVPAAIWNVISASLKALGAEMRSRGDPAETLGCLDLALTTTIAAAEPSCREAALSLAGLRLALFPDAPRPSPPIVSIRGIAA
jgi:uncharacterized membrane protein YccC